MTGSKSHVETRAQIYQRGELCVCKAKRKYSLQEKDKWMAELGGEYERQTVALALNRLAVVNQLSFLQRTFAGAIALRQMRF